MCTNEIIYNVKGKLTASGIVHAQIKVIYSTDLDRSICTRTGVEAYGARPSSDMGPPLITCSVDGIYMLVASASWSK